MCYGQLDPKYIARDIEARAKAVAFELDKSEEAAGAAPFGPLVWLRDMAQRMLRKDAMHV